MSRHTFHKSIFKLMLQITQNHRFLLFSVLIFLPFAIFLFENDRATDIASALNMQKIHLKLTACVICSQKLYKFIFFRMRDMFAEIL